MKSRWSDAEAAPFLGDSLALRAYTSRLLGAEPALVLHGGGNTSVKVRQRDFLGREVDVLWVKGSGWDLETIQPKGFAPVRMDTLLAMAEREVLSDVDMVREQRAAMLDPDAPTPSIEAILHAILPAAWVDHTHADAVVTLSNSPNGERRLQAQFGERVVLVPYVMPGFDLARAIGLAIAGRDLAKLDGIILLNHGVFTWGDTARASYERMIQIVDEAERALTRLGAWDVLATASTAAVDPHVLGALRQAVGAALGGPVIARLDTSPEAVGYANLPGVAGFGTRGPATPDHVIRTKRAPLYVPPGEGADDLAPAVAAYVAAYRAMFQRLASPGMTMLDPAPRWAIWPGRGLVAFGKTAAEADQVLDIARHTSRCVQRAEALGGWAPLGERDLFAMEYWELEQRKLRSTKARPELEGKVAVVTGAAHGIGRQTALRLRDAGAAVVAVDRDPVVTHLSGKNLLGLVADVTDAAAVDAAIARTVVAFGGLDMVVSNAGAFPDAVPLAALSDAAWDAVLGLNLDSHLKLVRAAAPHLVRGFGGAIVLVGSKNVAAPGPGVGAYSVAKAGLTQLARVAALELGEQGVRVNVVHPDAVFDTALWTPEKIAARAAAYGLSSDAYKKRNVLGREVRADDVAGVITRLMTSEFAATTGAQIPVDGGNVRVI